MKIAVSYYTRSGNTGKLAEAIASALGVTARPVADGLEGEADVLFLGSSPYAFDVDDAIKEFVAACAGKVGVIVCFGTSASGMSTRKKIKAAADKAGVKVSEEYFNCPGRFKFMHKGRPNEADAAAAAKFAVETRDKLAPEA